MNLSKLREIVKERESWCAAVHDRRESDIISNWTTRSVGTLLNWSLLQSHKNWFQKSLHESLRQLIHVSYQSLPVPLRFIKWDIYHMYREGSGFPSGSMVKNPSAMQEPQEIFGLGKFPRGGHGDPPQYSCLENSTDRETWWATVHRSRSQTLLKWVSTHACT